MKAQFIRVALVKTDLSHLVCIGCGKFNTDFAVVNGPDVEPEAGVHKKCILSVHARRTRMVKKKKEASVT